MLKLARGEGNDALVCCAVSGLEFRRLVGHRDYVSSVGFNPTNPSQLVSASWDKTIRLWDVDSGKELKKLEGHSPDNEECTCKHDAGEDEDGYEADLNCPVQGHSDVVWSVAWGFDGKLLASGGAEHKIILWDPKKGARLKTLEGHSDAVFGVAWSIDGLIASASRDRTLKLWNPSAGECLKTLEGHM
jgi:WD40 repeat protein